MKIKLLLWKISNIHYSRQKRIMNSPNTFHWLQQLKAPTCLLSSLSPYTPSWARILLSKSQTSYHFIQNILECIFKRCGLKNSHNTINTLKMNNFLTSSNNWSVFKFPWNRIQVRSACSPWYCFSLFELPPPFLVFSLYFDEKLSHSSCLDFADGICTAYPFLSPLWFPVNQ